MLIKIWTKIKSPLLSLFTNISAHKIDDIEIGLDHEDSIKVISQKTKVKDLYFNLLKSSKKEIMLIFPTNKAFERQERIGIIDLIKQVAGEKDLRVLVIQGDKVIDEGATGADYGIVSLSGSCGSPGLGMDLVAEAVQMGKIH